MVNNRYGFLNSSIEKVTAGDWSFGLSFLSRTGTGNASVSPYSLRTALALLYEGAVGETAREIETAAHLPADAAVRREGFRGLIEILNSKSSGFALRAANGLWVDRTYTLQASYTAAAKNNYGAQVAAADFFNNASAETDTINKWVSQQTEGKIPQLFPTDSLDKATALALVNALYFKGEWEKRFDKENTIPQDFTLAAGEVVPVEMMRKGLGLERGLPSHPYAERDGVQAALLPYKGNRLAKMVVLPPRGGSIDDAASYLSSAQGTPRRGLRPRSFSRLELPRHELNCSYDLKDILSSLGIKRMWSDNDAELTGIGDHPLFVTKGIHQTYFKTDEEGSEGAAATGFGTARTTAVTVPQLPVEFVADRPFLEAVVDKPSGAVLFLNRIMDPRK